jgi:hypothetical protein
MTTQDNSREAFEAWYQLTFGLVPLPESDREFAFNAWQAAEAYGRTEQATEIAELKAQIAEIMPLAKLGALVARKHLAAGGGELILPTYDSQLSEQIYDDVFAPNIEATITKLLKD